MRVINWLVPQHLEALVQRFGRCVRDGSMYGIAIIFYPANLVKEWNRRKQDAVIRAQIMEEIERAKAENAKIKKGRGKGKGKGTQTASQAKVEVPKLPKKRKRAAKPGHISLDDYSDSVLRFISSDECLRKIIREEIDNTVTCEL